MKRSGMARRSPLRRVGFRRRRVSSGMPAGRREECLRRDGWSCQAQSVGFEHVCFGPLEVHHIRLRSQGGGHDLENLVTLCRAAHRLAHDVRRAEAEACGLIRRAGVA